MKMIIDAYLIANEIMNEKLLYVNEVVSMVSFKNDWWCFFIGKRENILTMSKWECNKVYSVYAKSAIKQVKEGEGKKTNLPPLSFSSINQ